MNRSILPGWLVRALKPIYLRLFPAPKPWKYRVEFFKEVTALIQSRDGLEILEIGPKDFVDTRNLLTLNPRRLTLLDLPGYEEKYANFLKEIQNSAVNFIAANFMYDDRVKELPPYDLIWCTGVLYHNPEQLRMLRALFDLLKPGGLLVMESATTRNPRLINEPVVEIVYPVTDELKKRYRISSNVTHLPSKKAIASWLNMIGYSDVVESKCLETQSRALAKNRAAFTAWKPVDARPGTYYSHFAKERYEVGKSL